MKRGRPIAVMFELVAVLFVCVGVTSAELNVTHSTVGNWSRLFDQDNTTCLDPLNDLRWNETHYVVTLETTAVNPTINITAMFQGKVRCLGKQIFTTWYDADCSNGGYYRPCTLLSDVTTQHHDCQYACRCATTACEVVLADRKYDDVHICEMAVIGS